jgi:hypothetical protein
MRLMRLMPRAITTVPTTRMAAMTATAPTSANLWGQLQHLMHLMHLPHLMHPPPLVKTQASYGETSTKRPPAAKSGPLHLPPTTTASSEGRGRRPAVRR